MICYVALVVQCKYLSPLGVQVIGMADYIITAPRLTCEVVVFAGILEFSRG
jgi:hypothetical protein